MMFEERGHREGCRPPEHRHVEHFKTTCETICRNQPCPPRPECRPSCCNSGRRDNDRGIFGNLFGC
ncbi:MAG: hypothetical protein FWD89_03150 [Firmicutes bacterium]|nr:hypothetical protein [Bacillota bacterium]MCL2771287.1 hypothetical protein [Bacillota bacterium]